MRKLAFLSIGLFVGLEVVQAQSQAGSNAALEAGVKLVKEGAFEPGLLALDSVVRDLESRPGETAARARAHIYLGVAYVGLEQETAARRHFKDAIALNSALQLDASEFSPRVLRVFEAARKGKSKAVLYGGGIGVVGIGGAVAAGALAAGGAVATAVAAEPTPTPTPVPLPTPTATPAPTATPTPAAVCTLTLVIAPENAGCQVDVNINGSGQGATSSNRTYSAPCSARVQLSASNSAGPSATWSNSCSGSALGVPCVLNPLGSNRFVGLTCTRS